MFGTIAARYDLINDLQSFGLHRYWKRRVIKIVQPQPGESALDVCCGTGDLAFGLHRILANVFAIDFSASMLELGRQRQEHIGTDVQFLRADALADQAEFPKA